MKRDHFVIAICPQTEVRSNSEKFLDILNPTLRFRSIFLLQRFNISGPIGNQPQQVSDRQRAHRDIGGLLSDQNLLRAIGLLS